MTTRWPSGCLSAVSSISYHHHATSRLIVSRPVLLLSSPHKRRYAKGRPRPDPQRLAKQSRGNVESRPETALPPPDAVKSAFQIVSAGAKHDPINPPRSTIPPPLDLPVRGDQGTFSYLFNLGRAYGRFYKNGIKAVWYNYRASRALWERLQKDGGIKGRDFTAAVQNGILSRSDFQLLKRNAHDIGKLPLFGVLVLIFGEWLPLIVPFIPNAVPTTCRIPKQQLQMQEKAEERRRRAFMLGVSEPSAEQWAGGSSSSVASWSAAFDRKHLDEIIGKLRPDQLYHLSCTLTLHKHIWDRVQLPPPSFLLRGAIARRLQYLAQDDLLLLNSDQASVNQAQSWSRNATSKPAMSLSPDELRIALAERGFDVLGHSDETLRGRLIWWLDRQLQDEGNGGAMFGMLFRRLVMREWVKLNLKANRDA